jgi:hypothetical protein
VKGASWRDLDVFDLDALGAVIAPVDVVVSGDGLFSDRLPKPAPLVASSRARLHP